MILNRFLRSLKVFCANEGVFAQLKVFLRILRGFHPTEEVFGG